MTENELREILDSDDIKCKIHELKDDNAIVGLLLIRKYLPTAGIEAAEHDVIYSVSLQKLCEAGLTKEDAIRLKELNWHDEYESLACFV